MLEQALELIRAGKYGPALEKLAGLIDGGSVDADEALGHRAFLFLSVGRYEDALADYDKLIQKRPDDLEVAALRGKVLLRLKRREEGVEQLCDVIRRNPALRTPLEFLTEHQEESGNTAEPAPFLLLPSDNRTAAANAVIEKLENDESSYPSSVFPEVGRFLYDLVRLLRPRVALETGSCKGYSTLVTAQAMADNGAGHLHAFDLFLDFPGYVSPVLGPCEDAMHIVRGHVERAGLANRVTLHKGDSSKRIRQDLADCCGHVDFAFIDGDHTLRGCLKDWMAVDRLLAPGAVVLLHDTEPDLCGWLGPRYLLEKLGEGAEQGYHWINMPSPEGFGLALIQKKKRGGWEAVRPSLRDLAAEQFHLRKYGWK